MGVDNAPPYGNTDIFNADPPRSTATSQLDSFINLK